MATILPSIFDRRAHRHPPTDLLGFGTGKDGLIVSEALPRRYINLYREAGNNEPIISVQSPDLQTLVSGATLCLYAVTEKSVRFAQQIKCANPPPPLETVVEVNSKRWSFELRRRLGVSYGDAHIQSLQQLTRVVDEILTAGRELVVKEEFGVAGGGTLRIRSQENYKTLERLLRLQLDKGKQLSLIVEPWLKRDWDFSALGKVEAMGAVSFLTLSGMINSDTRFRASYSLSGQQIAHIVSSNYLDAFHDVGSALAEAGYEGLFCLDSMVLENGQIVPIVEVNARASIGCLNLFQHLRRPEFPGSVVIAVDLECGAFDACDALADTLEMGRLNYQDRHPPKVGAIVLGLLRASRRDAQLNGRLRAYIWLPIAAEEEIVDWITRFETEARNNRLRVSRSAREALEQVVRRRSCARAEK